MISENTKNFCNDDITKIENYELAMADKTQIWDCHHKLETHTSDGSLRMVDLSKEELIALGMYFDRPAEELIFIIHAEHMKLHRRHSTKKVLCVETGEVFNSSYEASKSKGFHQSKISRVCLGKLKTTGGYHWRYA